jgi:hypothetical protein
VPAYRCRHHNSPGTAIQVNIAMFWVDIPGHIIMLVLGLVPARTYLHTSPMPKPPTPIHVFKTVRHPRGIGPTKPCIRVPARMPMDTSTHATLPQRAVVKSAPPSQPLHPAATVQCRCGQLVSISGIQQFRSIPLHQTFSSFISHFFSFSFPFPGQFFSRFAFA